MAATHRRRKKSLIQKKQKSQQLKRLPKRKTSQLYQRRWKSALKLVRSHGKKLSLTRYITTIMGQLQQGNRRMSAKARGLMKSSMCNLYSGVFTEANRRRMKRRGSFIGTLEVQAALEKVMKGNINVPHCTTTSIHSKSN